METNRKIIQKFFQKVFTKFLFRDILLIEIYIRGECAMTGHFGKNISKKVVELRDNDFSDRLPESTWVAYLDKLYSLLAKNGENTVDYLLNDYKVSNGAKYKRIIDKIIKLSDQFGYGTCGALKENFLPVRMPDPVYFEAQLTNIKRLQEGFKQSTLPRDDYNRMYVKMRENFVSEFEIALDASWEYNDQTVKQNNIDVNIEK